MKKILIIAAISSILAGCIGGSKITRRYDTMTQGTLTSAGVDVTAMVQPEEKPTPAKVQLKSLFDLSPEGQKALIEKLGTQETDPKKFLALLQQPLSSTPPGKATTFFELTKFNKIITISIKKLSPFDADRISRMDVSLKPNNNDIIFTGCDKIVTNYVTADLGNLKYTQTATAELAGVLGGGVTGTSSNQNVNGTNSTNTTGSTNGSMVTAPVEGITTVNTNSATGSRALTSTGSTTSGTTGQTTFNSSVTGKLGSSRTFSEEVALRQRYINLTAYIKNKELHFYQESVSGIDVSGNITAKVNLEFTGQITETTSFEFASLFTAGAAIDPKTVAATQIVYSYPNIANDVSIAVKFNGVLRKVKDKARTITESDDIIELLSGDVDPSFTTVLLKKSEFTPKQWYLASPALTQTLSIQGPVGSANYYSGPLYFNTYETAMEFYQYLQNNFAAISANGLQIGPAGQVYTLHLSDGSTLNAAWVAAMLLKILQ